MSRLARLLALLLLSTAATSASAHEGSTGYLTLHSGDDARVAGRLDVALIDIAWSVPLDADHDGLE